MKPRLTNSTSLNTSAVSRASSNNHSFTSYKPKSPGGIQTSLRKGLPKNFQFASGKDVGSPDDEESIWKGIFNNRGIFDYINVHSSLKGALWEDIEELRKLPGGNIWHLPPTTSLENGKTIDVATLRCKILAGHFRGAENVPEKVLKELFPNENDRKNFLMCHHSRMNTSQNEKISTGGPNAAGLYGKQQEGEAMSPVGVRRSIFVRNAKGELEEIFLNNPFPTRSSDTKQLLLKGEFADGSVGDWTFEQDSGDYSVKGSQYDRQGDISQHTIGSEGEDSKMDPRMNGKTRKGAFERLGIFVGPIEGEKVEAYGLKELKQLAEKKGAGMKSSKDQLGMILKQSTFGSPQRGLQDDGWKTQAFASNVDHMNEGGKHDIGQFANNYGQGGKFLNSSTEGSVGGDFECEEDEQGFGAFGKRGSNPKSRFASYGSNALENRNSVNENGISQNPLTMQSTDVNRTAQQKLEKGTPKKTASELHQSNLSIGAKDIEEENSREQEKGGATGSNEKKISATTTPNKTGSRRVTNKQTTIANTSNKIKGTATQTNTSAVSNRASNTSSLQYNNGEMKTFTIENTRTPQSGEVDGVEYEYVECSVDEAGINLETEDLNSPHKKISTQNTKALTQGSKNLNGKSNATQSKEKNLKAKSNVQTLKKPISQYGNDDSIRISESEEVMEFKQSGSITTTTSPKSLNSLYKANPDQIMEKRTSLADTLQTPERAAPKGKTMQSPKVGESDIKNKVITSNGANRSSNEKTQSKLAPRELNKAGETAEMKNQLGKTNLNQTQISTNVKSKDGLLSVSVVYPANTQTDSTQGNVQASKASKRQSVGKSQFHPSTQSPMISRGNSLIQEDNVEQNDIVGGEKSPNPKAQVFTTPQKEVAGNSKERSASGKSKLESENKLKASSKQNLKSNVKEGSMGRIVGSETKKDTTILSGISSPKNLRNSSGNKLNISVSLKNGAITETLSPKANSRNLNLSMSQQTQSASQNQPIRPFSSIGSKGIQSPQKLEHENANRSNLKAERQQASKRIQDESQSKERVENHSKIYTFDGSDVQKKYSVLSRSPQSRGNNQGEANSKSQTDGKVYTNAVKNYHIDKGYGQGKESEGDLRKSKQFKDLRDKKEVSDRKNLNQSGATEGGSVIKTKERESSRIKGRESEDQRYKSPLNLNRSLDFEARSMCWETNRKAKISEQLKLQEEESIKECTFSPKINANTQKILLSPKSALKQKLEKAKKEQEEAELRKSLMIRKANSASDFTIFSQGKSEDHFSMLSIGPVNNRPDPRTLSLIKFENELEQHFPWLHITKCASDVSSELYYKDVIKALSECTVEERNLIWREVETSFLLMNSPEEVEKATIERHKVERNRSLSPSAEPSDYRYIKETHYHYEKKELDRLAILKSFLMITQKIAQKKQAVSQAESFVKSFDEFQSPSKCKSPVRKTLKDERYHTLGSTHSGRSASTFSTMVTPVKEFLK